MLLDSYAKKCKQVKDFTLACLKGNMTGLLLFGSGGNGKSWSVRETLREHNIKEISPEEAKKARLGEESEEEDIDEEKIEITSEGGLAGGIKKIFDTGFDYNSWVNHQGRITPKGLVKEMSLFPKSLHLVEDAETMFDDKNCWGVLRMALHSQDKKLHSQRRVNWTISTKDSYDFIFQGSLIIVGNRLLNEDLEEVKAVQTRCPCLNFQVTNPELVAKMKDLCDRGYSEIPQAILTKNDCYDVLEFILTAIEEDDDLKKDKRGQEKKLNLRILDSGFRLMAFARMMPEMNIDWQEMLLAQLKSEVGATRRTRAERVHDEKQVAIELSKKKFATQEAKLVEWCKLTGRNLDWASKPKDSPEYIKGFRAAKTDLGRKLK